MLWQREQEKDKMGKLGLIYKWSRIWCAWTRWRI